MIIEETDTHWPFVVVSEGDGNFESLDMRFSDYEISVDKHQAAQLVEVLQKWLAGEEVE